MCRSQSRQTAIRAHLRCAQFAKQWRSPADCSDTPEECLAGTTREAALALGLDGDRGTLETGKRADIAIWDVGHPRELSYWLGIRPLAGLLIAGRDVNLT